MRFVQVISPFFVLAALVAVAVGQVQTPVTIGHSETLFTVLAAINNCGYDAELASADPLREKVREEIGANLEASEDAKKAADSVCGFYRDHQQADTTHTLSQYVSLALYMNPSPAFTPKVKEADLPPDASGVLGLVPLVQKFYAKAGIHDVWQRHEQEYSDLSSRYHEALAGMIRETELYLRMPSGSYGGRTFTIYVEPLGAPSEVNARSYGDNYYVVITPGAKPGLKMDQIHHAYLHFLLDNQVGKFASNLTTLGPILDAVKLAPMDESFKADPVLLVTECVIRAIEARTLAGNKAPVADQERAVEQSMSQGFVLTRYFYDKLPEFEKGETGFKIAFAQMLAQLDVRREQKRAGQIEFASAADPELLQLARPKQGSLLIAAQNRLAAGDAESAEKLAKQALAEKSEDPGRALFILAQISLNRNIDGARDYFEQALKATSEPKVVAWSHIYLGRIFDLEDQQANGANRAQAIEHYKAASEASDDNMPEAKAAAEQGLQQPYAPPQKEQGQAAQGDDKN